MDVEHANKDLERLECDRDFTTGLPQALVRAFRKTMQLIRAAPDERDFYKLKSMHFEKLKGKRKPERSMRLNKPMRLIVEFHGKGPAKTLFVKGIEDYH